MKPFNVLASTTRQWNPGDEFILIGIRRLLEEVLGNRLNILVHDRNPDVLWRPQVAGNSWRGESLKGVDLVVFAGTPEWHGSPARPLAQAAVAARVPTLYLGIGSVNLPIKLEPADLACLRAAAAVVCRDTATVDELRKAGVGSIVLPCPAFFAAPAPSPRTSRTVSRVGVCFQVDSGPQRIEPWVTRQALELVRSLSGVYELEAVCHYKAEYFRALALGMPVRYSYDARDYADIYSTFDAVVSTRVHGAILAASCAVPALAVRVMSPRAVGTCGQFPGMLCPVGQVAARLAALHVDAASRELLALREQTRAQYLDTLRGAINRRVRA